VRRLFWFGAGIAAGVALTRKVNETARKATPTGMAEQVGGAMRELAGAVGSFGADVRAGMQEREDQLQDVVVNADQVRRIAAEHDAERRARRAGR
jgi:chromosome condensin MukBEF MukE localization factor